jgi:hypothetical protein
VLFWNGVMAEVRRGRRVMGRRWDNILVVVVC